MYVAFDPATTRCCCYTYWVPEGSDYQPSGSGGRVFAWSDPAHAAEIHGGVLTDMLYKVDGQGQLFPISGNTLEMYLRDKKNRRILDPSKYLRGWKLGLHDCVDSPVAKAAQDELFAKIEGMNMTIEEVMTHWVSIGYDEVFELHADGLYSIRGRYETFASEDIRIVVTVPPGRSLANHNSVRQTFVQGPIKGWQVSLLTEAEAAFNSHIKEAQDTIPYFSLKVKPCWKAPPGTSRRSSLNHHLRLEKIT
jgi:hypothetical protein